MSISAVNFNSADSGAYINITPTAGNSLFVTNMISGSAGPCTGFTAYSSTAGGGTALGTFTIPAALASTQIGSYNVIGLYLLNIPSGINSIKGVWTGGTPGSNFITVTELSGVASSGGFVTGKQNTQSAPGTGANAITTGTTSVSSSAKYLLGVCSDFLGNNTFAVGSSYTIIGTKGPDSIAEGQGISSSGSYAATFTDSTNGSADDYATWMFALAAAGSGNAYTLSAATGYFSATGETTTRGFGLSAPTGYYSMSGEPAARDLALPASQGSFGLTGYNTGAGRNMSVNEGSFSLTGFSAILNLNNPGSYNLNAAQGAFGLTGHNASAGRNMAAPHGIFGLTGFPAVLVWSGASNRMEIVLQL
jgi:hypothetical protein